MRALTFFMVLLLALPALADDASPKVKLDLKDVPLRQALDELTKQTNVPIITSPGLKCMVNLTLQDVTLDQAVLTIASAHGYRWKRVELAVAKDTPLAAETIAEAITALESLSFMGLVVADREKKTQTVFGKELPAVTPPQLPDGYKWQTVYLLLKPAEEVKDQEEDLKPEDVAEAKARMDDLNKERLDLLMSLSPEERQTLAEDEFNRILTVEPELRRDMFRGWVTAVTRMDPEMRRHFSNEMRDSLGDMFRGQGQR